MSDRTEEDTMAASAAVPAQELAKRLESYVNRMKVIEDEKSFMEHEVSLVQGKYQKEMEFQKSKLLAEIANLKFQAESSTKARETTEAALRQDIKTLLSVEHRLKTTLNVTHLTELLTSVPLQTMALTSANEQLVTLTQVHTDQGNLLELTNRELDSLKTEHRTLVGTLEKLTEDYATLEEEKTASEAKVAAQFNAFCDNTKVELAEKKKGFATDATLKLAASEKKLKAQYTASSSHAAAQVEELSQQLFTTRADLVKTNLDYDACLKDRIESNDKVTKLEEMFQKERHDRSTEKSLLEANLSSLRSSRLTKERECIALLNVTEMAQSAAEEMASILNDEEQRLAAKYPRLSNIQKDGTSLLCASVPEEENNNDDALMNGGDASSKPVKTTLSGRKMPLAQESINEQSKKTRRQSGIAIM